MPIDVLEAAKGVHRAPYKFDRLIDAVRLILIIYLPYMEWIHVQKVERLSFGKNREI